MILKVTFTDRDRTEIHETPFGVAEPARICAASHAEESAYVKAKSAELKRLGLWNTSAALAALEAMTVTLIDGEWVAVTR